MSVYWGNGKHFETLDLQQKQNTIKWMMAAYVPGIETLGFPKLADTFLDPMEHGRHMLPVSHRYGHRVTSPVQSPESPVDFDNAQRLP
ncbi:hypothetical protein ACHAP7_009217 [Fusarium lateritium]